MVATFLSFISTLTTLTYVLSLEKKKRERGTLGLTITPWRDVKIKTTLNEFQFDSVRFAKGTDEQRVGGVRSWTNSLLRLHEDGN